MKTHVDRASIVALFEEIRARFPMLAMNLELDAPNVDLNMDVPEQAGLAFDVNLNLQGDELHLSVGAFWLEWFPCTDSNVAAQYRETVMGILSGVYRIVEHHIGGHVVKAQLQRPVNGGWQTIGTSSNLGALLPWPRSTRVLRNAAIDAVTTDCSGRSAARPAAEPERSAIGHDIRKELYCSV
jgi:hypothetical protein